MASAPLARFHAPVRDWFRATLGRPTRAQELGWGAIARGASTLVLAPTGSGKTLAAFLSAIDRLVWSPEPAPRQRCRVLYVSPLKALAVDVERNLRAPLAGVVQRAQAAGDAVRVPTVAIRTGDTPARDRARMQKAPPDILITTPESLYLLLTSSARAMLASVDTVIVDEIHQLVPTKRGAHLFLSLERLERLRRGGAPRRAPLQRVGLSATQRPLDEVARLLGGFDGGEPRPVEIVDAGETKRLALRVEVPDVDMARLGERTGGVPPDAATGEAPRRTIWPDVHERLVELVRAHRSTMIFVNSRRLAERMAAAVNEAAGAEIALAHHGSVARERRAEIEDRLKRGDLPAIVATSSMELGVDMGAVDLVVQVEAPPSVASGLQRIGRASHQVGGTPSGIVMPKHRADLLAAAASIRAMRAGDVEAMAYPRNPLDVLAQQIVAVVATEGATVDALYELAKSAAPFAELPRASFEGVLDMLAGRYPSTEFAELRARVTWDRARGKLSPRPGAQKLAVLNGGTIPDRGLYGVFLAGDGDGKTSRRVGELDEEMVFELREGEVFLLGASSWRAAEISRDRVLVTPADGAPGKMPFWHGDRPGRPAAFGAQVGKLTRDVAALPAHDATAMLSEGHALDASAARNLVEYVVEQRAATREVPSDRTIVVERFADELGDWRICVLSPFGSRVHAPWATAVLARLRAMHLGDVEAIWSDDGMVFRVPSAGEPPDLDVFFPPSGEVEGVVTEELGHTALFAARFRENAARALLLPRNRPGTRTPLWMQRKRSADLLAVASQHPTFPIVLETYRECLRDVFDLAALVDLLRKVETRRVRVAPVVTERPSPFAASLLFSFVGNFIYDGDAPLAERRVRALSIDHAQLRELLGEAELRKLLDPEVIEEVERTLQRRDRPPDGPDAVHDLLLWLGDLSRDELRARARDTRALDRWVAELVGARRAVEARVAGKPRLVAVEDAARYRDALGAALPRGLPASLLGPSPRPLVDLVARYARTHGPFTLEAVAARFGASRGAVREAVAALVASGKVVEGAFLPDGRGTELCDASVLRTLRRKSLARVRREVEPVDGATYARFLDEWHGLDAKRRGPDALLEVVGRLQGLAVPASDLELEILPARLEGYRGWELDALCASGEIVWAGVEPLGPADGRIALFLAEHEARLAPAPRRAEGALAEKIRALLERRGAVFFAEIARAAGGYPNEALDALWDMVFAGEVTNDTLEPLRSLLVARGANRARARVDLARGPTWRGGPPGSEGRWSLRASRWGGAPSETERRAALAQTLLERHGVVTREAVQSEGVAGGFAAVYDVLKAMEEAGRIRRGYFVAGRGAAQFALPGADDRLRARRATPDGAGASASRPRAARLLAASDPASPYGAALPWPEPAAGGARPQRAAGARVILFEGALVGFLGRAEDALLTFLPAGEPDRAAHARALAHALATLVTTGRRKALSLATIDGAPAREHACAGAFVEAGFAPRGDGSLQRRADRAPAGGARQEDLELAGPRRA